MDIPPPPPGPVPFRDADAVVGTLDRADTARIVAAAGDVTLVVDRNGVIRDLAIASADLDSGAFSAWVDQPWADTVTAESREKIAEMLRDAAEGEPRWRQVNHEGDGAPLPIRYFAMRAGADGPTIAIGRDMRMAAALQQRLLAAQQSMERDYLRLRQIEMRYRLLFELSAEPVLIIDGNNWRISDASPAARRLLLGRDGDLSGQSFFAFLHPADRDAAIAMLGAASATRQNSPVPLRLARDVPPVVFHATLFREDRGVHYLVRADRANDGAKDETAERHWQRLLDRLPDAFVVTGPDLAVIDTNLAFLDLTQLPLKTDIIGQPLAEWVGRPGIDLGVLVAELETHGMVRNFETIFRSRFGDEEPVEISAAIAPDATPHFGFAIRTIARRLGGQMEATAGQPRSVDQLTELVGRVPLKDIVRESTDLIERLCIEAALEYTSDNRANAAEMLGLSRQSLYSKLRRHGIFTPANAEDDDDAAANGA